MRELERGGELYRQRAWRDAYEALRRADQAGGLSAEDLQLLAISAYLIGRDKEALAAFERAHHAAADADEAARAARCAFWMALILLLRGQTGRANGWLARAQRLLDRKQHDDVEWGYLQLPAAEQHLGARDFAAAFTAGARAAELGERFHDRDLTACARHLQGRALLKQGRLMAGLSLLDECMVAVTAGELSPLMTGLLYCSVLDACGEVYALHRAREWTSAMAEWCDRQPQLAAFTDTCLVHRSEVMLWSGDWREAFEEARTACRRSAEHQPAAAFYQQGEVHRLRGELTAAEKAYRRASQGGCEPQPGLALLRLAQGRTESAVAAMHRVVRATTDRLRRTRLLPAYVEVLLAAGEVEAAREAACELRVIAASLGGDVLEAMAEHARGAVELAAGDAQTAIATLRRAQELWQRVGAPYPMARARELIARACHTLGDDDGTRMELDAAQALLARLGAAAHAESPRSSGRSRHVQGLTAKEVQVLGLIAAGKTNKRIAAELGLSERTVDRHVSKIFMKIDVSSRAAATAYAYEHDLI